MKVVYKCWFHFKGSTVVTLGTEGVSEFKDGFWVTGSLQLTRGLDAQYWIPPSMIRRIEKGEQECLK